MQVSGGGGTVLGRVLGTTSLVVEQWGAVMFAYIYSKPSTHCARAPKRLYSCSNGIGFDWNFGAGQR